MNATTVQYFTTLTTTRINWGSHIHNIATNHIRVSIVAKSNLLVYDKYDVDKD